MIGYFVLSNDMIIEKCEKYRMVFGIVALAGMGFVVTVFNAGLSPNGVIFNAIETLYAYCSILAFMGTGKKRLNFANAVTNHFSKSSFFVYVFHLLWMVIGGYYIVQFNWGIGFAGYRHTGFQHNQNICQL
ncbi:MAG: hypothetical protein LBD48_03725 [Treponema sp.]|jgi:hypothetical protein|nr:hypothetical protein [Treponema sp.]